MIPDRHIYDYVTSGHVCGVRRVGISWIVQEKLTAVLDALKVRHTVQSVVQILLEPWF